MANFNNTFNLRNFFIEARHFVSSEILIKKELISFLESDIEKNINQLEFEVYQLELLELKYTRFETLAGVIVVHPDKENVDPFLLTKEDINVPNFFVPIQDEELNFLKKLYNYCETHNCVNCNICNNTEIQIR